MASFIGIAQALTNQSSFFVQGALYHKTAVEMSYSVSRAYSSTRTFGKFTVFRSVQQLLDSRPDRFSGRLSLKELVAMHAFSGE